MLPPATFTLEPCDPALVQELRQGLGCTETLAWILARRGIDLQAAHELLADESDTEAAKLHDPLLLGDMAAAVERIGFAIERQEPIVVHGDYDADGVCSTTLLVEGLEQLGASVRAFLPDRFSNGYGLQLDQVERFARDGARLLIAVDCGITAVEAVAHARDLGMEVVICDHHVPGPQLPDAIICSTQPSDYPFPHLCATAVAGKLLLALGGPSGPAQHELEAIATVADCVPLVGENRTLVRRGLRALRATTRPGLLALIDRCGLRPREVDAEAVGFKIAPRINAVGRIDASERAYELLRASQEHAPALAHAVDETNERRRAIERDITAAAIEQVDRWSAQEREARIYLVHGSGWHEGVVGIVASRLVERYCRPVVVVADGDPARASGRSIEGVDLHAALGACDDLLLRWGGHAQAGGLTVDPARLPELRTRLADWGEANIDDELLQPRDSIDAIVPGSDLRFELVQELERIAPFGNGWERPRLLAIDAVFEDTRAVGGDGSHLRCHVRVGDSRVPGIGFGMAVQAPALAGGRTVDVALRPSINRFRGVESLQVELHRVYPLPDDDPPPARGWCATSCALACAQRVSLDSMLGAVGELVPPDVSGADPDLPPALEPLLVRSDTVDLRHRGCGQAHVAQLLAAGVDVVAVVADVSRRRAALGALAHPDRFGAAAAMLASERCSIVGVRARLHRVAAAKGPRLLVVDHATLPQVLDAAPAIGAVVVLDPPVTERQRDVLAAVAAPLHLTFGAPEQRFAADALRAALDVRGTLGDAWRQLRRLGPVGGTQLEELLLGSGEHLHAPSAVVHGLRSLLERGVLQLDAGSRLAVADEHAAATASRTT